MPLLLIKTQIGRFLRQEFKSFEKMPPVDNGTGRKV